MTAQDIVDKVHDATVEQMCTVLFNALLITQDGNQRQEAEQRFQAGVRKAREVRDRVKQLLP